MKKHVCFTQSHSETPVQTHLPTHSNKRGTGVCQHPPPLLPGDKRGRNEKKKREEEEKAGTEKMKDILNVSSKKGQKKTKKTAREQTQEF